MKIFQRTCQVFALCTAISFSFSPDIYSYLLNDKDFKELEAMDVIFGLLDKQRDLVYPDTTSMLSAIQADMIDFPDAYPYVASHIRDKVKLHFEYSFKSCYDSTESECPVKKIWMDSIDLEVLKGGLRNSGRFVVVAPQAIQIAKSMQDIEYPDSSLFLSALRYRLQLAFNLCPENLTSKDVNLQTLKLSGDDYEALKLLWTNSRTDLNAFRIIDSLRFSRKSCNLEEWKIAVEQVNTLFELNLHQAMSARIRKFYRLDTSLTIQWSGKDCGCTQEDAINGVIYGFFPFWNAQREPLRMDFGVLNRVAYYGLTFDASGMLAYANQTDQANALNTRKGALDFVREAHQFRTRVDWVIEKNRWGENWMSQSEEDRKKVLRNLARQIVDFITAPLDDIVIRVAKQVSYAPDEPTTRGDGVDLYFRNYPTDSVSTRLFEEFYKDLKDSLKIHGNRYYVNFMATRSDMAQNKGIYSYQTFWRLLEIDELSAELKVSANQAVYDQIRSYLLLFLEEPTSHSKQALRFEIDHVLQGLDHKILLRSLIPVLSFDYKSWGQLSEDIAYFNDAFFGIGLWPVKSSLETVIGQTCAEGANLPNCLRQDFFQDGGENELPSMRSRFTCAHRWGIRLATAIWWGILLLMVPLIIFVCQIRHRITKNPLPVLAIGIFPPCLLFTMLLFYDPVLAKLREGNWPFVIMLILVLLGGGAVAAILKYKKEKPVRTGQ